MLADVTNASFELGGAIMCAFNVARLLKDRVVQGVHWWVTAFFTAWGFWNLYYYPSLGQWASFAGGVALASMNALWVGLAIWFTYKK